MSKIQNTQYNFYTTLMFRKVITKIILIKLKCLKYKTHNTICIQYFLYFVQVFIIIKSE